MKRIRSTVYVVHEVHYAMDGFGLCSEPKLSLAQDKFVEEFVNLVVYCLLKYFAKHVEEGYWSIVGWVLWVSTLVQRDDLGKF